MSQSTSLPKNAERWIERCIQLASLGAGGAAPNPMVGAVLVDDDTVIAEGWHKMAGGPHAEVSCLQAVEHVPPGAVLYVNLEPCAHHGRTPPCADLIIKRGVREVVIGQRDPFPAVSGKGLERLRSAGVIVHEDVLSEHCRWLQRRFLTSVEFGRPYIILKWAQSKDGFLDQHPRRDRSVQRISAPDTDVLVHRWRAEEQAILVGSRTVKNDNPSLTVRHVVGRQPLRIVLDRSGICPVGSQVFDGTVPTLLFGGDRSPMQDVETIRIPDGKDPLLCMMKELNDRSIRSLLVEGGSELLSHFIRAGLWDEARVIQGAPVFLSGTAAPVLDLSPERTLISGNDKINFYRSTNAPALVGIRPTAAWVW